MKKGVFIYGLTDVKSISKPTGVDKKVLAQIHAINAAGLNCKHFYTKRESWVSPTLNKKAPWCNFPSFRCFSRVQKFFFKNIKRVFFRLPFGYSLDDRSAVQIRKVAGLIGNKSPKIVVLSAMSGTTNTLVEIAGTLKDGDRFRFGELVGQLEFKYVETVNDLFGTESCRRLAVDGMTDCFRTLWKMPQAGYTPENEKVILAQGELLSTLLMHLCLKEMNIESVVLPALEFMRLGGNGEPDGRFIRRNLCKYLRQHRKCSLFITQGYICRNAAGEIDNLQRGGSDYTASLIGAAVRAEEIQIWTDIDGLHNNDRSATWPTRFTSESTQLCSAARRPTATIRSKRSKRWRALPPKWKRTTATRTSR